MTETEPAIHRAARLGDLLALERLLVEGADIELRHDADKEHGSQLRQLTPLMTAARSIDGATDETILWLLERGASLHAVSGGGVTAAWYAAGKGGEWWKNPWHLVPSHAARLKVLLDAGLDPNEASCTGRSLLSEACYAGDPDAVKLLLERGVSPEPVTARPDASNDFRTSHGYAASPTAKLSLDQIPIFGAVESGSVECVELLLANGAKLIHLDEYDYDYDLLDVALTQDNFYTEDYTAPPQTYVAIAKLLLDAGVPLERTNHYGQSRLYWIAFCQQLYGVAFLLEQGASLEGNPLHGICFHGPSSYPQNPAQERIVRMLVAAGASLDMPIHTAIFGDIPNANIVRVLLELGANPNETIDDGSAPLHWAAQEHSIASIQILLQYGADVTKQNNAGQKPVDIARKQKARWEEIAQKEPEYQRVVDEIQAVIDLLETAASGR